jgi:hypothetical protein
LLAPCGFRSRHDPCHALSFWLQVSETDSVFEQLESICAKNGGKIVA